MRGDFRALQGGDAGGAARGSAFLVSDGPVRCTSGFQASFCQSPGFGCTIGERHLVSVVRGGAVTLQKPLGRVQGRKPGGELLLGLWKNGARPARGRWGARRPRQESARGQQRRGDALGVRDGTLPVWAALFGVQESRRGCSVGAVGARARTWAREALGQPWASAGGSFQQARARGVPPVDPRFWGNGDQRGAALPWDPPCWRPPGQRDSEPQRRLLDRVARICEGEAQGPQDLGLGPWAPPAGGRATPSLRGGAGGGSGELTAVCRRLGRRKAPPGRVSVWTPPPWDGPADHPWGVRVQAGPESLRC